MSSSSKNVPLRSALKTDDDGENRTPPASGSLKAVQIAEPVPEYRTFEEDAQPVKQFRASHNRRLSGKMPSTSQIGTSSRSSASANELSPSLRPVHIDDSQQGASHQRHHHHAEKLVAQVSEWLERQQAKQANKKSRHHHHRYHRHRKHQAATDEPIGENAAAEAPPTLDDAKFRARADSIDSQSSDMSLDKLAKIIEESRTILGLGTGHHRHSIKPPRPRHRRRSIGQRTASSDTDYVDGDVIVPDCDVVIDNSKAMGYSGGSASTPADEENDSKSQKDREGWLEFKNEIIRTAHTLRLKGWRRVPLGGGDSVTVERICGALTNAVYSVTPPSDLSKEEGKKQPAKLLLRIYGPQVEHLIDRDIELGVLQRLARKKIGPRLLGTFKNGRFEQYFNAAPLTPEELRDPEVSRQIAKRTRELHAGIELLSTERDDGPAVWKAWDKWQEKAIMITDFVDKQFEKVSASGQGRKSGMYAWRNNGYVCGVPYPQFQETVIKYRQRLDRYYATQTRGSQTWTSQARKWAEDAQYTRLVELLTKLERQEAEWKQRSPTLRRDGGDDVKRLGRKAIRQGLVFAHNDTQYGNILRFQPDDEKSPLLQPANKHKQLVVIDFEYAAANMPGYEFANHFIEWTYNYHANVGSHLCDTLRYPRPEEQYRYLKGYVDHRPQFPHVSSTPRLGPVDAQQSSGSVSSAGSTTPKLLPTNSSSSIVDFMLDSRAPPGGWSAAEKAREEQTDREVRQLMDEAMLWRPASHAFWITWGIMQAPIPGLEEGDEYDEGKDEAADKAEADSDEFDYLGYSQDRAYFFWGDMVQLGIVKAEELPESLRSRLKLVDC